MVKTIYVLKKPIISEKSLDRAAKGFYTFAIDIDANKQDVKKAVETQWKINVLNVRTLIRKGVTKRTGRRKIKSKSKPIKYAIVQIPADQKIDLFEVVK